MFLRNTSIDFELIKNGREQNFLYNNFLYRKIKTNENVYFVCIKAGCIAKMLSNHDIKSIRVIEEHNQLSPTIEIKTIKIKQELFSDTRQNPTRH